MNRLAGVTSPYLLQHADNPVDWWPWSPEAFEEARRRDVPVLLSVGYASCHWCHVMAHESFEDSAVAEYLNAHFVPVKVDREERPDVDAVYMEAVQAATGQGGWPMTVFLTADAEPFYFGTYFPPEPRHGMPAFRQVLEGVVAAWSDRREEVAEVAGRIVRDLAGRSLAAGEGGLPGEAELAQALLRLTRDYDEKHGGFGGAPKFPPSMVIEFLLRHHARTGAEGALQMAADSCAAMAHGGIYDQLGGGFARYSVDREWIVPHFEKMLYDNALLCRVYAHLWRATGSDLARRVALETADFMVRELRTAEGGFASALDADSEDAQGRHVEGAFYVWTPAQLREVLGEEDAGFAAGYFGVTEEGTFEEGSSVLRLMRNAEPDEEARVAGVRARLLAARELRARPERDDKIVAAWNGLAIAALAETGAYFDRPDLIERATEAADLLVRVHMGEAARLCRTSRDGRAGDNSGVLEDHGDVAEGFLALASVTGEGAWLDFAGFLLDIVLERFTGEDGQLFDTADDAERLIRRPQDPTDSATPAGWTAAAGALLSYAAHTGSEAHRTAAERALGIVGALGPKAPRFIGWGLAVAEALLDGPREVAVAGPVGGELHRTALLGQAPGAVVAAGEEADAGTEFPLLVDRPLVGGEPTAYVCRHFVCDAPTTDAGELAAKLGG
ncbi:thioredoxin domain-containing protein [Streptomyces sp. NE06-03E]|uniref:Thioredoxin domain-containing protein n=1 Tax=Streptomyces sp. gb1(2016) TaxID=1828321 RepID=A0A652KU53_9ACTN|nr:MULTISPECIES: thioredoxin domain-containing protein [unclassified Streptomyces]WSS63910.1 thioredoxin domain-containing protein [Streptomyces sp. NBC_01177]WSS70903.1 thioredoxin domain-containing protein [Streptomyces sp. NBC_01175]MDX3056496.1 thioredoxin domain-containing protein [Streptomyces sp. NE06-03E]MDX3431670.1 thioredoxin domain-containing protein [Streptomyces sp. ME01-18a]MDX3682655.1 thioredoxin domain-containing protein [Streptomyces sp. AK04-4c]